MFKTLICYIELFLGRPRDHEFELFYGDENVYHLPLTLVSPKGIDAIIT